MVSLKKYLSCILLIIFFTMSSISVCAKGNVFNVEGKGITYIEAENCSDYIPALQSYFGNEYMPFNSGQWMDYFVNVEESGLYTVTTYVGRVSNGTSISFTISLDGENAKTVEVPDSGDWLVFDECELVEIELPEGRHTLRFSVAGGGCHFDSFSLKKVSELKSDIFFSENEGAFRGAFIPAVIQAEDYDKGDSGSKSIDGVNNGGKYRRRDKLDIYSKNNKDFYIVLFQGEYANYTFDVCEEGIYALYIAKGTGNCEVYLDGLLNGIKVDLQTDGDFKNVFVGNILLEEGRHTLSLVCREDSVSIDSFRFKLPSGGEYYTQKHFETGFAEKTEEISEVSPEPTEEPTEEPSEEPTEEPIPFSDISGHWACENIKDAAKRDMVKGFPDGTFRPENNLTVSEACIVAMRVSDLTFAEEHLMYAINKYGLIDTEDIARYVTREEFAKIIISALNYETGEIKGKYSTGIFVDESNISIDKFFYVYAARSLSLMNGDENGKFRPADLLTRAEMTAILTRIK